MKYLYIISDGCIFEQQESTSIKVGVSAHPDARLLQLQTGNPRPLKLRFKGLACSHLEKRIHQILEGGGTGGGTEWFAMSDPAVKAFCMGVVIGKCDEEFDKQHDTIRNLELRLMGEQDQSRMLMEERDIANNRCEHIEQVNLDMYRRLQEAKHEISSLRERLDEFGLGQIDIPPLCPF